MVKNILLTYQYHGEFYETKSEINADGGTTTYRYLSQETIEKIVDVIFNVLE